MDPPSSHRSSPPPSGTSAARRLQPVPELRIVVGAELVSFEHRREAEHLARLEADQDLINELQWAGFEGPGWQELAMALAEYGLAVMTAWLSTGAIVRKCREKHIRGVESLPVSGFTPEEVEELANLVVGEALGTFRERVLKTHRWDPQKGASLKTYFVGHCCIRFVGVFRRWKAEEGTASAARRSRTFIFDPAVGTAQPGVLAPDIEVVRLDEFTHLVDHIHDPITRSIFILKAQGYTDAEIAEALETSVPAVKSRTYSFRRNLRKAAGDDS